MLDAAVAAKSAFSLSSTVALFAQVYTLSLSLSLSLSLVSPSVISFLKEKRTYILFVLICKFCPFCQAIAMVFKDMVKERNFISTCAFIPILLYVLCQCIYV